MGIGVVMGGLSGLISSFTGSSGAKAARDAGRVQQAALTAGIPGAEEATAAAIAGQEPFAQTGVDALSQQRALLGLGTPEEQAQARAQLTESPGQKFLRERQERALLRNTSATGGLGGGNVKTALQEQAAGRAAQLEDTQFNRLAGLSTSGQNAATNIGSLGVQGAQTVTNLRSGAAQAQASGLLGAESAKAAGVGNILSIPKVASLLSDENMKQDIEELDLKLCYDSVMNMPLKSWRYLESAGLDTDLHFGPMAQSAPDMIKIDGKEMLNLHDELMMISGAIKYMGNKTCH